MTQPTAAAATLALFFTTSLRFSGHATREGEETSLLVLGEEGSKKELQEALRSRQTESGGRHVKGSLHCFFFLRWPRLGHAMYLRNCERIMS